MFIHGGPIVKADAPGKLWFILELNGRPDRNLVCIFCWMREEKQRIERYYPQGIRTLNPLPQC
eukprot:TRINITY_DN8999_c0_g1_i1.p1 TRINITY_DN8999_c0_g1~~TRINITY_DN8999_c0_g1_i1.p1  ORF type:complete len:63 (+),score=0.05 TRINITY_DN8999_c0_g1_i1:265-453(+)